MKEGNCSFLAYDLTISHGYLPVGQLAAFGPNRVYGIVFDGRVIPDSVARGFAGFATGVFVIVAIVSLKSHFETHFTSRCNEIVAEINKRRKL